MTATISTITTPAAIGKPAVICLHASGGSGAQWSALADLLRQDFRLLTPDLCSHGAAPEWPGPPEDIVAADTARIARLAAKAGGEVHLVGHSYGGAIALRVALLRPQIVASIAVYEPVALRLLFDYNRRHRPAAEVAELAGAIRRELNGGRLERAAQRFVDYWSGAEQWTRLAPERREALARRMPVIHAHFVSLFRDAVRLRGYATLELPVLYLSGRETRASARRITELLASVLPNAEFATLSGMGHMGPVTHATTVAQRIARFVLRQAARPALSARWAA